MPKKVKETLDAFLFKKLDGDPVYRQFRDETALPTYISDNLSKTLRPYQEEACMRMMYQHENGAGKHLLCNMATGSGENASYGGKYFVSV